MAVTGTARLGTQPNDGEAWLLATLLHRLTGEPLQVTWPILPMETAETSRLQL